MRTLIDRKDNLVTKSGEKEVEMNHIKSALSVCGYPEWTFKKVQVEKEVKKVNNKKQDTTKKEKSKGHVVLPYIQGTSEKLSRIMRNFGVSTSHKPYQKLRDILVHPKDKLAPLEQSSVVYKIDCRNCDSCYIGETGRVLSHRVKEHRADVNKISSSRRFTRLSSSQAPYERNKSALTDHVIQTNHVINFDDIKVIDKESKKSVRLIPT